MARSRVVFLSIEFIFFTLIAVKGDEILGQQVKNSTNVEFGNLGGQVGPQYRGDYSNGTDLSEVTSTAYIPGKSDAASQTGFSIPTENEGGKLGQTPNSTVNPESISEKPSQNYNTSITPEFPVGQTSTTNKPMITIVPTSSSTDTIENATSTNINATTITETIPTTTDSPLNNTSKPTITYPNLTDRPIASSTTVISPTNQTTLRGNVTEETSTETTTNTTDSSHQNGTEPNSSAKTRATLAFVFLSILTIFCT